MRVRRSPLSILVVMAVAGGCGGDFPAAPSVQLTDSAGVHYPLFNIMWPVNDSLFALQQSHRATPGGGETPIPEGQFVWRVFSTRGFYAGAIVLPIEAAQPYWIEDGRIIATRRDSLGVATIESYLLTPPT